LAAALGVTVLRLAAGGAQAAEPARPAPGAPAYATQVAPLVEKYCVSCHSPTKKKGGLDLTPYQAQDTDALLRHLHVFQDLAERVESRDMPPDDQPQPTEAEIEALLGWVDWATGRVAAAGVRDPGRVTIRRLNRAEYNNTVRDLLGVNLNPAQDFPSDDVGYGFDNIGDVLTLPPVLVERYLQAAERIAERAIVPENPPKRRRHRIELERLVPTPVGSFVRGRALVMEEAGALRTKHTFVVGGEYAFRLQGWGRAAGGEAPRVVLRLDGKDVKTIDLATTGVTTVSTRVEAGPRRIELAYVNPGDAPSPPGRAARRRQAGLDALVIDGPLDKTFTLPESHVRVIPRAPGKTTWQRDAREFVHALATRAYRRPVTPAEVDRLTRFVETAVAEGDTFEQGMQLALRAILVSPHFLFRVELDGDGAPDAPAVPVDDFQLASRLSYFLWSSMPDEELFRLAREGVLRKDEVLEGQVRRMLADRKARALVDNFATQWLQTRNLGLVRPNRRQFPGFDDNLRADMARETELFFEAVLRDDLPVATFLDADFTFLNQRLARHYGIDGVKGNEFRRVTLADRRRGGVLTQASVLTVTSNPTRTSPVKRGRWVLEQLLGTPPPPPPPGVPELPEQEKVHGEKPKTLREMMERHRADPNCATCHKKMDPLGFGLESFDAVGAWRDSDEGFPVDSSGVLPNGQRFAGPAELKAVLLTKEPQFRKALATKLLTYALGRGAEPYDRPAVDEICEHMARNGHTFSSLVVGIVKSDPFLKRRPLTAAADGRSEANP
jgi:mono/diheme cytochrome c family protein